MKKILLPFLLLITLCSSDAENTEPQNTGNNEQSQELAQNEQSQELAQNEQSQELAQNEQSQESSTLVDTEDLNCDIFYHHDKERSINYWGGTRAQVRDESCYPMYQMFEAFQFEQVGENFENERCLYVSDEIEYLHPLPVIGKLPIIYNNVAVIPVTFADTPQSEKDKFPTQQDFEQLIFGFDNKINEYFRNMSNGLFSYDGKVFPTVNLSQEMIFEVENYDDLTIAYGDSSDILFKQKVYDYLENGDLVEQPNYENVVDFQIPGFFDNYDETGIPYDLIIFIPMWHNPLNGAWASDTESTTPVINGIEIRDNHTSVIRLPLVVDHDSVAGPLIRNDFTDTFIQFPLPLVNENGYQMELEGFETYLSPFERTLVHEWIHTFGIGTHANSMIGNGIPYYEERDPWSNEYFWLNYGDLYDVMGKSQYAQYLNAAFRTEIGWLGRDNFLTVVDTYEKSSIILGDNLSFDAPNVQAIHVHLPNQFFREQEFSTNVFSCMFNKSYFIESISQNSPYAPRLRSEFLRNNTEGVFVRYFDGVTSQLLDMSPSKFADLNGYDYYDISDVVLKPGEVFEDAYVYIHNQGKNPDGSFNIDVQIKENSEPWGW